MEHSCDILKGVDIVSLERCLKYAVKWKNKMKTI